MINELSEPTGSKSNFNNALEVRAMEEDWSGVVYVEKKNDDDSDDDDNDDDKGKDDDKYY